MSLGRGGRVSARKDRLQNHVRLFILAEKPARVLSCSSAETSVRGDDICDQLIIRSLSFRRHSSAISHFSSLAREEFFSS